MKSLLWTISFNRPWYITCVLPSTCLDLLYHSEQTQRMAGVNSAQSQCTSALAHHSPLTVINIRQ